MPSYTRCSRCNKNLNVLSDLAISVNFPMHAGTPDAIKYGSATGTSTFDICVSCAHAFYDWWCSAEGTEAPPVNTDESIIELLDSVGTASSALGGFLDELIHQLNAGAHSATAALAAEYRQAVYDLMDYEQRLFDIVHGED